MVFGLVMGLAELAADASLVDCMHTLDYSVGGPNAPRPLRVAQLRLDDQNDRRLSPDWHRFFVIGARSLSICANL